MFANKQVSSLDSFRQPTMQSAASSSRWTQRPEPYPHSKATVALPDYDNCQEKTKEWAQRVIALLRRMIALNRD